MRSTAATAKPATCAYALSLNKTDSEELADYFCKKARRRIETRFRELTSNDDRFMNEVAKSVLEGNAEWLKRERSPDPPCFIYAAE